MLSLNILRVVVVVALNKKRLLLYIFIVNVILIFASLWISSYLYLFFALCQYIYSEVSRNAWRTEDPKACRNLSILSFVTLGSAISDLEIELGYSFALYVVFLIYWAAVSIKRAEKAGL